MLTDLDNEQKKMLWELCSISNNDTNPREALLNCGHETAEENFWRYTDGEMPAAERDRFWQEIKECRSCLQRLFNIQQAALKSAEFESYPLERVKQLIKNRPSVKKAGSSALEIILDWAKDSLNLLRTTGQILPPQPALLLRGAVSYPPVMIGKEFKKCRVELSVERVGTQQCNIDILVFPLKNEEGDFRANLSMAGKLLASSVIKENKIGFNGLSPGRYRITLVRGAEEWGEIFLDINRKPGNED